MISVEEAERLLAAALGRLPAERRKLVDATGRILRRPITADRDGPPFNRAMLDGVCLRSADWEAGKREFALAGTQAAGAELLPAPPPGACLEIMTGAPVPEPCDLVVRVEDTERSGEQVRIRSSLTLASGHGVHRQAGDFRKDQELVPPGRRLSSRELAIAASCGFAEVEVTVEPRIAVVTTGDELVEIDDIPKPHQIRRSNDLALRAVLEAAGHRRIELNHLPDNPQALSWNMERLLQQADAIVVTGGVSKGRFDHLPAVLKELGVQLHFHGVAQRPGRPMAFGTFERPGDFLHPEDTRVVAVFALPGNPVSAFTCAHHYVLPALSSMVGLVPQPPQLYAALATPTQPHPKLTLFVPACFESTAADARCLAHLHPTNTSGDFASLAETEGYVRVPPGKAPLPEGTLLAAARWR